jgi:hypothetical protein
MPNTPYFQNLVAQSKNVPLHFCLLGNGNSFMIRNKPYNALFVGVFFLLVILPILLLTRKSSVGAYLIIGIIALGIFLAVWYWGTNDVVFNSQTKTITVKNNNVIGRLIKPATIINYKDVTAYSFRKVNVSARGFVAFKHNVYIQHSNKKK